MGMYDIVKFETQCPECGETLNDFQTKETDCTLSVVEPFDAEIFYTSCPKCNAWVDVKLSDTGSKLKKTMLAALYEQLRRMLSPDTYWEVTAEKRKDS